jgi:hypothetical protein
VAKGGRGEGKGQPSERGGLDEFSSIYQKQTRPEGDKRYFPVLISQGKRHLVIISFFCLNRNTETSKRREMRCLQTRSYIPSTAPNTQGPILACVERKGREEL